MKTCEKYGTYLGRRGRHAPLDRIRNVGIDNFHLTTLGGSRERTASESGARHGGRALGSKSVSRAASQSQCRAAHSTWTGSKRNSKSRAHLIHPSQHSHRKTTPKNHPRGLHAPLPRWRSPPASPVIPQTAPSCGQQPLQSAPYIHCHLVHACALSERTRPADTPQWPLAVSTHEIAACPGSTTERPPARPKASPRSVLASSPKIP